MRTVRSVLLLVLAASIAGLSLASDASYKKCPLDTQTCLDQMVAKMKGRGWLGIEYDDETWVVKRIVPGSPAEKTGFKVGDVLVSVAGVKFTSNTEAKCLTCDAVKDVWKPGKKIPYTVKRKGRSLRLTPTLAALPSDVMAQMIGMHMIEHAQPETPAPEPAPAPAHK
jgi:C-terminal processing protease CtpA/Prc